jgi:Ca-activated chloride channel family protein
MRKPYLSMIVRFIISFVVMILFATLSMADQLYSKNKKANELYKKGEYQEALKMYDGLSVESPNEPKLKMNKGSTHYRLNDLTKAEESYSAAASQCKDKKTLADLFYNLGNIQYKLGEELSSQGKQEAMEKYKEALENYIKSLDIKPSDRDAKWNLQLASARIKQMQNQQNKQQNKNDKNNQDQNKDQNKNQQQNKDQEKKDQEKQQKDQQKKDNNNQDKQNGQDRQNENKQDKQKPEPTPAQKKEEMKKDEAKKLLELYSDDEHDLNKKPEKKGIAGEKRTEKDW